MQAWELVQQGWKQRDITEALGVGKGAVNQWVSQARAGGVAARRRRQPPDGVPKLGAQQRAQQPALLARGPAAGGFAGEIWTLSRVAQAMEQEYGVSYHPTPVGRILKDCSWSWQQPALRATRGGARRPSGTGGSGAASPNSKKAVAEGRTILWADASGF